MSQPTGPSLPTIGRIVHVVMPHDITVPAIVTALMPIQGVIACSAFLPGISAPVALEGVPHDEGSPEYEVPVRKPGPISWHWPTVTR